MQYVVKWETIVEFDGPVTPDDVTDAMEAIVDKLDDLDAWPDIQTTLDGTVLQITLTMTLEASSQMDAGQRAVPYLEAAVLAAWNKSPDIHLIPIEQNQLALQRA